MTKVKKLSALAADETPIDQLLARLDEEMAWFHSESFRLEEAQQRFVALRQLAAEIERRLLVMKHEIEVQPEASFTSKKT